MVAMAAWLPRLLRLPKAVAGALAKAVAAWLLMLKSCNSGTAGRSDQMCGFVIESIAKLYGGTNATGGSGRMTTGASGGGANAESLTPRTSGGAAILGMHT